MGSKNPWLDCAQIFLVVGVHNVITPFKFGDDRFGRFWLAEGQSLPFPIDFEGRPCNIHTIMWSVITIITICISINIFVVILVISTIYSYILPENRLLTSLFVS